jgi:hypothetical protein
MSRLACSSYSSTADRESETNAPAENLGDAIGRGEVDMLEVGGNVMFFASDKVLEGMVGGS